MKFFFMYIKIFIVKLSQSIKRLGLFKSYQIFASFAGYIFNKDY